ncbi:MAG: alpha-glucosidase/alpha-galactosidase [Lentisphaeria bacterium]|nr:alpha-glucosidase/alpha-galactosidase [Lentisphaeria bacterium]
MAKIVFMGAGSSVFAKNIIGDCMFREALQDAEVALYDIDGDRLKESLMLLENLNKNINQNRMKITGYLGVANRKKALKNATFVVNAIQVGGYEPSTVIDFEIPKKYGLRQTIADTLGIGGIFRGLRTIPVMLDFARDMEEVCPNAWFLNYTNPMAMLTGAMLRATSIKTVGLCHSVQVVADSLLYSLNYENFVEQYNQGISLNDLGYRCKVAGINHMAWLLEITKDGKDIYPRIRKEAAKFVKQNRGKLEKPEECGANLVRLEMLNKFGYYVTESSEHNAEYAAFWIKDKYPELVREFGIPLDEYPRRCINQIARWKKQYQELLQDGNITHKLTREYGSGIMNAIVTNHPYQIGGNVLNHGFIENLPADAVVEVPCLVDGNGVQGTHVGRLPVQCAAMNMTNINVQLLTIEAALTQKKEHIYQAAMLDPHTASELSIDDIVSLCNDLIKAHGDMLPKYR